MPSTNPTANNRAKTRLMVWMLAFQVLLSAIKFFAWFITGSDAILSDALESLINVLAGSFALFSVMYASRPQDDDHPYGHGKVEYFSVGFEGGLILVGGLGIMANAIYSLAHPVALENMDWGIYLSITAGLANGLMGLILIRNGRRRKSHTLQANGKHLLTDTVTSVGMVAGLVAIWLTDALWLDSAIALVMALFILYTGVRLLRQAIGGLMDTADTDLLRQVVDLLCTHRLPQWIDLHNLRVKRVGSFIHLDCYLTVPYYLTAEEVYETKRQLAESFATLWGTDYETYIDGLPCFRSLCAQCAMEGCPGRNEAFVAVPPCTLQRVVLLRRPVPVV